MAETKSLIDMSATGNVEAVKMALQRGGDPNKISEFGRTPLHVAASKGYQEVVAVLLEHPGVDPYVVTPNTAWSSLHLAVGGGHYKVVALLLQQPGIEFNLPHPITLLDGRPYTLPPFLEPVLTWLKSS